MIPNASMLENTFCICQGNQVGTAFAIQSENQRYLVTARHVLPDSTAPIYVMRNDNWELLSIGRAYHHPGSADVAVIPLRTPLVPNDTLTPSAHNVMMGQDVLIAGFPFGWTHPQTDLNDGYPLPFIKGAILSTIMREEGSNVVLLDGHNNKGFSGGPIIAEDLSFPSTPPTLRIIGVVSTFTSEILPHPDELSKPLDPPSKHCIPHDHVHLTNSGFFIGYEIQHALEVIQNIPR